MAEIIRIAKKESLKTHIMFEGNLSSSQLNRYLETLSQTNLLEKLTCDGKEFYKATPKGLCFLEKQCQIIKLLNEDLHVHVQLKNQKNLDYNLHHEQKNPECTA